MLVLQQHIKRIGHLLTFQNFRLGFDCQQPIFSTAWDSVTGDSSPDLDSKLGGLRVWEEEVGQPNQTLTGKRRNFQTIPANFQHIKELMLILNHSVRRHQHVVQYVCILNYMQLWYPCQYYWKRSKTLRSCRYSFLASTSHWWTRQPQWWGSRSWT